MQTRHRTPSVFNISMVDVLCCALGCVILLWLLNLRDAKQKATTVGQTSAELEKSRLEVVRLSDRLRDLEQQGRATAALLAAVRGERDKALARGDVALVDLSEARTKLGELDKDLAALRSDKLATDERLAKVTRERSDLAKDRDAAARQVLALEASVKDKDARAATALRRADDLATRLLTAEERAKKLREQADLVPGLQTDLQAYRTKAEGLETQVTAKSRELADSARRIAVLEDDKKVLADEASRARAAADNRFAGIALAGKRVVFLVDMSGSMELVDANTLSPDKWPVVRETLLKIMRSLPNLEKYQVILFSDRVLYPLKNEGRWLDYDPKTSPGRVQLELTGVRPRGDTDMYAGLEAAFRFRGSGLDTIYFFSDGLPNIGQGLSPADVARKLSEPEKTSILSKHIRNVLKTNWNRALPGQPKVRINAIGFFYESPDVGAFLWALAREHEGSFVGMSRP